MSIFNKKWISCLFLAVITVESSSHKIMGDGVGLTHCLIRTSMGFVTPYVSKNFLYGPVKKICDSVREYVPQSWKPWITPGMMGIMIMLGSIACVNLEDPYDLGFLYGTLGYSFLYGTLGYGLLAGDIDQLIRQQQEQNRQQHQDEEDEDTSWKKTYSREENPNWTVQPGT